MPFELIPLPLQSTANASAPDPARTSTLPATAGQIDPKRAYAATDPLRCLRETEASRTTSSCAARFIGVGCLPSQVVQEISFPGLKREAGARPLSGCKSGAAHATVSEPQTAQNHCATGTGRCRSEDFRSTRKSGDRPETRTRRLALGDVRPVTISAYRSLLSSPRALSEPISTHVACVGVDR